MKGNAYPGILTGVPGWESEAEQKLLAQYAEWTSIDANDTIVDLGTEFGQSLSIFAKFGKGTVVSVDIREGLPAKQNLKEAKLDSKVHFVVDDALKIGRYWTSKSKAWVPEGAGTGIAILFIDDLHETDHVAEELRLWAKYVKPGGVILLHDVACETNKKPHEQHHWVKAGIDKWLQTDDSKDFEFVESVDSLVVYRRMTT